MRVNYNIPVPEIRKQNDTTAFFVLLDDFQKSSNKTMCFTFDTKEECKHVRYTINYLIKKHNMPLKETIRERTLYVIRKDKS